MSKVSDNVLGQIKESNLKPIPKWYFVLLNIFLIIILVTTILAGGLVVSLAFLHLSNLDWEFISFLGEHDFPPFIQVLPALWLGMIMILLFISIKVFSLFERSHKYSSVLIVLSSISLSIILGAFIYSSHAADFLERSLRENIRPYSEMQERAEQKFMRPEKGLLPGIIIKINSPSQFELLDLRNKAWKVEIQPNTLPRKKILKIETGQAVMLIGKQKSNYEFEVHEIRVKRVFGMNMRDKIMRNPRFQNHP